jgi:hypothetical protein
MKTFIITGSPAREENREFLSTLFPDAKKVRASMFPENPRFGLFVTMFNLFASLTDYDGPVLVLEDDAHPTDSYTTDWLTSPLPENFNMVYLGYNLHRQAIAKSGSMYVPVNSCSVVALHSVIYSKEGREQCMDVLRSNSSMCASDNGTPVDVVFDAYIDNRYIHRDLLFTQLPGFSDIEKTQVDYRRYLENQRTKNLTLL